MQRDPMQRIRLFGILLLMALLVCVYTLTSSAAFTSSTEVSLFAVTESLAPAAGRPNTIAWTQYVNSPWRSAGNVRPGRAGLLKGPAPGIPLAALVPLPHIITGSYERGDRPVAVDAAMEQHHHRADGGAAVVHGAAARVRRPPGMVLGLFFQAGDDCLALYAISSLANR